MKNTINYGAILAPALLFSACGTGQKEVAEKPLNIIHIMTDDHSYQTISAYGHALGKLAPRRGICDDPYDRSRYRVFGREG